MRAEEFVNENLRDWFKEKWVRFGPDGRIRGDCARGSDSEGKPKCLPQSKAHALGKKGRASAAARKRREDPNPERSGPAHNVATKEAATSNAVTFFRGEPILSQERLNQLKSSIGKPYPIQRKEGSAANIGTYMSPDGNKATSFVQQALAGQGKGGAVTQIQVDPNSFSKGDGGIDEAVIITNIAGLVSDQTPNKNDPLRIQDRKQAMLKYLGPGVRKYLNDPLLSDPKMVQRWYNPEFAEKNWTTIKSGKQAVTKPGESEIQERMMSVLGPLAEKIRRDPEVISYFIAHNPGNWIEYNFRMNSDGSGTKVVDVKYYPPAKPGVAEAANPAQQAAIAIAMKKAHKKPKTEGVDIGQEWMSDTELDQYVPDQLQQQWRELLGYDQNGNPSALWTNLTGGYEPDVRDPEHRALMVKVANKWFAAKKIPNVKFFNVKDADDELEWLVQIGSQDMMEGTNPADTLYFFDVARGGRSFDHLDLRIMGLKQSQKGKWYYQPGRDSTDLLTKATLKHLEKTLNVPARAWQRPTTEEIAEACWPGYHKDGMKTMFGKRYPNCMKNKKTTEETLQEFVEETVGRKNSAEIRRIQQMLNKKFNANLDVDGVLGPLTKRSIEKFLPSADTQSAPDPERTTRVQGLKQKTTEQQCPECGGPMFSELMITEKQDACYYKVKSRYKVWPSAYASGALVQCRKKGAANWGNKSE